MLQTIVADSAVLSPMCFINQNCAIFFAHLVSHCSCACLLADPLPKAQYSTWRKKDTDPEISKNENTAFAALVSESCLPCEWYEILPLYVLAETKANPKTRLFLFFYVFQTRQSSERLLLISHRCVNLQRSFFGLYFTLQSLSPLLFILPFC